MENHHAINGKITIFNGKITIFHGKTHYFTWDDYSSIIPVYPWSAVDSHRAITEAKELFEEAASVGEADAQYNLAILYANLPVDNVCWRWKKKFVDLKRGGMVSE